MCIPRTKKNTPVKRIASLGILEKTNVSFCNTVMKKGAIRDYKQVIKKSDKRRSEFSSHGLSFE